MITMLLEPAVVVSTLIALVIALFSSRLARVGEFIIAHLSLFPSRLRARMRVAGWRYRRRLLLAARSEFRVTYAFIHAAVWQTAFTFTGMLYALLVISDLFKSFGDLPVSMQLLVSCPVYIFEALWLIRREKAKDLAKAAERQRMRRSEFRRLRLVPW